MRKIFFSLFLFLLLAGGMFLFHSCHKDRGMPPRVPFNFHVVEGFESSANLPSGWSWWNPDNDARWQVDTTVGHNSKNSMGFNNCSGDGNTDMTGRKDRCITPAYDFSKATSVNISFDVAYAVLNFKSTTYTDSLAVFSSTDGGSTWSQIYLRGGTALTNIPIITSSTSCYVPAAATDWRTDNVSVNNLAGQSNVMFAFENRSDWGEWIYLDNISITASNGPPCSATYAKIIQPIIQNNCATTGCHVPGGLGPTDFTTYAGVNKDAGNGTLKTRMINGNPTFMPSSGKLPDSTLNKIQCWLDSGAPNN